jgi:hypothetical protein
MSLRLDVMGHLSALAVCTLLGCSEDEPSPGGGSAGTTAGGSPTNSAGTGGGGAGSSSGGMLGTSGSTSGSSSGGAGASQGGSAGSSSSGTGGSGGAGTAGSSSSGSGGGGGSGGSGSKSKTTFFVTSDTSKTGKLGGLTAADKRCQDLAVKAGIGDHTFHAYLSTAAENAKDRIGKGPWVNSKGVTLAADLAALHASTLKGDHALFIDENGLEIDGQWNSSPEADWSTTSGKANQHDIFTGSKPDGTLQSGATCMDWTSEADADKGQVGHSDGMGPGMATTGNYSSWNSAHASSSCAATWKAGGAGRLYCFAID